MRHAGWKLLLWSLLVLLVAFAWFPLLVWWAWRELRRVARKA